MIKRTFDIVISAIGTLLLLPILISIAVVMWVVADNLLINGNIVQGWAFVPQEGNTLLSTIHAFILQTGGDTSVMESIVTDLTRGTW